MMNPDLTNEELESLYHDLGKSITAHRSQMEIYREIQCQQGVALEQSRVTILERIRNKIKERLGY